MPDGSAPNAAVARAAPRRGAPTALAFACFFALLAATNVLRPIREALGIEGGVYMLPVLWTCAFVATLTLYPALGALASRTTRTRFAAAVFATIAASLVVFRLLLAGDMPELHLARAYYVWVTVFNVLLASVFWGVMADVFSNEQGRRLFGAIAAGGTAGAVCGTAATRLLVRSFGVEGMLLVAAGLIVLALVCVGVHPVQARPARGPRRAGSRRVQARCASLPRRPGAQSRRGSPEDVGRDAARLPDGGEEWSWPGWGQRRGG
jgi:AAA family ATP:ADP antiporter